MSNPGYVRSTDGNDADDGSTWALANATLAGAITDAVAGDAIYISQAHAQTQASALTMTFPGTLASPNKLICANDGAEPPTAVAATGSIITTGANTITINGCFYAYGLIVQQGSGTGGQVLTLASVDNDHQVWENCLFYLVNSGANGRWSIGNLTAAIESSVVLKNCQMRFSGTGQALFTRQSKLLWSGGGLHTSGSAITTFLAASQDGIDCVFEGLNLSSGAVGMNLIAASMPAPGRVVFRNCKLPASWTGSLLAGAPANMSFRAEMHNCDSDDTNYRLWVEDYAGSTKHETTIVRTGGASDGTTPLAWKMATSANAEYPAIILESPEIVIWNDTSGSAKTVTVEIVHDSQGAGSGSKLQDDEIWLEAQYLGTSGFPLGTFISDAKADALAAAANQADSTEAWTTTGLTTPVKQKLSVTFTPQEKGYIHLKVALAKASKTVYVCPKATVT